MATFDSSFGAAPASGPAAARARTHRAEPAAPQTHGERSDGRRAGRLRCSMMSAALGTTHAEILDASATGARLLLRRNPDLRAGAPVTLDIDAGSGPAGGIKVACQVVWVRLNADKKFELGVEFRDLADAARKRLLDAVLNPTRAESLRRGWSVVGGIGVDGGDDDDDLNSNPPAAPNAPANVPTNAPANAPRPKRN